MAGQLSSLTDVLKKNLFFFDCMTVEEITPYVHRQMMKDYSIERVSENISLCLEQHPCFYKDEQERWFLNLEGNKDNDQFYNKLLSRQKPMSLKEIQKDNKKKKKKVFTDEMSLISDGRFIQLSSGYWGLTEWEVESGQYSLKQLLIKGLKLHPTGLSIQQLYELVGSWKEVSPHDVKETLKKFPYFEEIGSDIWTYNSQSHMAYENILKRFLQALERQRKRWHRDKEHWHKQIAATHKQIQEVSQAYRETAAALALRVEETGQQEQLLSQLAEKDLLLSLRKKEIYRMKENLEKIEAKANSILHQCRLWVQRARQAETNNLALRESLNKSQTSLETLFTKLQQYKEKDRENKAKIADLKDSHSTRVAELQTEIVELKQKLKRIHEKNELGERRLREEVGLLSKDLRGALEGNEDLQRALRMAQHELNRAKEEYKRLESRLKNPLVRLLVKLLSIFDRRKTEQVL